MVKIGVIGFGRWGKILSRCFSESSGFELCLIADISFAKREEASHIFHGILLASTVSELLDRSDIEAVAIATPAGTHYDIVTAALKAGKHVWVEKPVAETSKKAKSLALLAQQLERVLFIDHTFLYSDSIRFIKQMIVKQEFKELRCYESIRTNNGQPKGDTTIFHDLAIHDLAILDFLIDEAPQAVSVKIHSAQDSVAFGDQCITLAYASGMTARIRVNWCAPTKIRRIVMSSNRQTVEFDDIEPQHKLKIHAVTNSIKDGCDSSNFNKLAYKRGSIVPLKSQRETLANAVESFFNCVQTGKRPVSDGWQGLRLATIVDACVSSVAANGMLVEVSPAM